MANIEIKQGETLVWVLICRDENGDPQDLTGATHSCAAKNVYTGVRIELDVTVLDAVNGQVQLFASKATTAEMTLGRWKFDVAFDWADDSRSISKTAYFDIIERV